MSRRSMLFRSARRNDKVEDTTLTIEARNSRLVTGTGRMQYTQVKRTLEKVVQKVWLNGILVTRIVRVPVITEIRKVKGLGLKQSTPHTRPMRADKAERIANHLHGRNFQLQPDQRAKP